MGKALDLTGEKYGRLIVIQKDGNIGKKTAWRCLCDCGNEVTVITDSLRSGRTKSCGCVKRDLLCERNAKTLTYKIDGERAICYTTSGVEFYVDAEDVNKISDRSWSQCERGYLHGWSKDLHRCVYLHKYILDVVDSDIYVDHKDRNVLNNCKSNLRVCTAKENGRNRGVRRDNTSGFPGVRKEKRTGRWTARITCDGKEISLGTYETFREAVFARCEGEKQYFGEFAPHISENIIDEKVEQTRQELYKTIGVKVDVGGDG